MAYQIRLSDSARDDLREFTKNEQKLVLDTVARQLTAQPLTETRHRKPLRPNDLSEWQLRIGQFRVFYDADSTRGIVLIKAIGQKKHNVLFIRGREFNL